MKFNKWTMSLAALGVVSLASAVRADEKAAPIYLETAVSGTSISGYVNTSAQWNLGNNGPVLPVYGNNGYTLGSRGTAAAPTKADGFNLDAVEVTVSKSLDDSQWASGYNFSLVYGQDAGAVGQTFSTSGTSYASIKDAYVELRTPVGNGIDWKVGVFDTILGYEVFDAGSNPNYTRSYGYAIEPTTHTGVLAAYSFADWISVQAGIANTTDTGLGSRTTIESHKAYLGSVALTAPNSWGFLAGSTLYGAVEGGRGTGSAQDQINYYAGAVLNTGVKGLKVGASYDYLGADATTGGTSTTIPIASTQAFWANAVALYTSFQATEKLSLHARAEYAWIDNGIAPTSPSTASKADNVYALTGTVQYDLWKNVLSRVEIRWDHANTGVFGQGATPATVGDKKDSVLLAANLIYKF
jgi:Putative beta-barrel porin-2, OmpL-like. bbp2